MSLVQTRESEARAVAPQERAAPLGQSAPPEQSAPLVTPPDDRELYWYMGPQRRWVQLISVVAFGLAASSLVRFSLSSPWLYPLIGILAVSIVASILSMISGLNRKRYTKQSHLQTIERWHRDRPTSAYPSVDVFLPSAGEDLDVLRNTYTYVARMRWEGELDVWVLDDAAKPEVEALAREYGFHYRTREDRGHLKKAGNLRFGYGQSSGDFIIIFDADFCPRADFLDHTIPYLDDERIGILQTPQFFDTKTSMNWLERTAGATQELFYRWVQPSRDRASAPICVGTCAVYRRAALRAAGGFAQIEHSEDVHTGIKLTRAGYVVRYLPILVSRGLCPSDLAGFLNQQYRWCNGSMTLLASGQANRRPVTVRQSIAFWSGFLYYISTAINVFFLHVPGLIMALFFADQVRAEHYIPFLLGMWVYFVLLPRVMRSRWRFEVMRVQMAYSFCHALAIVHKLTGRTRGWVATGAVGKGKGGSLAKTISSVGIVALSITLGASWIAFGIDVATYGIGNFWAMALFLAGYTYLGAPLLVGFVKVRFPREVAASAPVVDESAEVEEDAPDHENAHGGLLPAPALSEVKA
ncbi:cellulose synthase catalytic subunit [Galbitalea sp. SE-J8]|uniref:glycosyltransferase family 2 protein n=1 Tax=Galbitalea sp. SE-J8 TaxID=3054952 RepID=UPI00259CDB25|nr:cellulose synthase catalytic subunit [Galbitalea sp. SE-J8]MDM4763958.1 cellulose synthase catalytic subunit [Galbitalea sp. SE-J8]